MEENIVNDIQAAIGYTFREPALLEQALKHSSSVDSRIESNERLEFFGDAILNMVICRSLFSRFPHYLEGDLTKVKSMLVSRRTCSKVAGDLQLDKWVFVSRGVSATRAFVGSIAAGAVEAVIAAIYVDGGYDAAAQFVLRAFGPYIEMADAEHHHENFKSLLQQHAQQLFQSTPIYQLLDEKGPDHNKAFEVGVSIAHRHFPTAWGINKKEAEQKAAYNALVDLGLMEEEE